MTTRWPPDGHVMASILAATHAPMPRSPSLSLSPDKSQCEPRFINNDKVAVVLLFIRSFVRLTFRRSLARTLHCRAARRRTQYVGAAVGHHRVCVAGRHCSWRGPEWRRTLAPRSVELERLTHAFAALKVLWLLVEAELRWRGSRARHHLWREDGILDLGQRAVAHRHLLWCCNVKAGRRVDAIRVKCRGLACGLVGCQRGQRGTRSAQLFRQLLDGIHLARGGTLRRDASVEACCSHVLGRGARQSAARRWD